MFMKCTIKFFYSKDNSTHTEEDIMSRERVIEDINAVKVKYPSSVHKSVYHLDGSITYDILLDHQSHNVHVTGNAVPTDEHPPVKPVYKESL